MIRRKSALGRNIFFLLLASLGLVQCEWFEMESDGRDPYVCEENCVPLRISGQYQNLSEPGTDLGGLEVEIYWAKCWFCRSIFTLHTDETGKFSLETEIDSAILDQQGISVVAKVDTSRFFHFYGHASHQVEFPFFNLDLDAPTIDGITVESYRKAYLDLALVEAARDSFENLSVTYQVPLERRIVLATYSGRNNDIPASKLFLTVANLPVALTWQKSYFDGSKQQWQDTLLLRPGEIRPYQITY